MQTPGGWEHIHLVLDANVLLIKPFASCSSAVLIIMIPKTCPDLEESSSFI